jgi:glycosyltransferase involved in cell wall biosynthesis
MKTSSPHALAQGTLDGLTILRFAHAFEGGGGVERHLADLNRALGDRNQMTAIELRLTRDPSRVHETEDVIGRLRLITVPLLVPPAELSSAESAALDWPRWAGLRERMLDRLLRTRAVSDAAMRQISKIRAVPMRAGAPEHAGQKAAELIERFGVDLVVLHANGSADASEIIRVARSARIPIGLIHHFSNDRLGGLSLRQQICWVDGVGGASWIGVPNYLRKSFWNLSDAVDTDFYSREQAHAPVRTAAGPILYAPARVTPEKGQLEVLEVASRLKQGGVAPTVIFAGRVDSPVFQAYLERVAADRGLSDSVRFLGQLSLDEYRDWYCLADVLVLPTRHSEGMPRTLIESQAMKVPPVVYDIGGTSEGLRDRETGFVVRRGDLDAMSASVERLITDRELRRSMGEAGRRFVERAFSLDAFARRHEDFYMSILAGQSRSFANRPLATPPR